MKILITLLALLWAVPVLGGDPIERTPNVYSDSTGWAIASAKPAADLQRWIKFEDGMNRCPVCMEEAARRGLFTAFRQFWMEGVFNYWAISLDIPHDMSLIFDSASSIVMTVRTKTDTVEVRSNRILFPVGWDPYPQHSIRDNTEGPVYVKAPAFGDGPTSEDYEWVRFRSEWDDLPKYYVLGYAKFDLSGLKDPEPIGWHVEQVTSYRR